MPLYNSNERLAKSLLWVLLSLSFFFPFTSCSTQNKENGSADQPDKIIAQSEQNALKQVNQIKPMTNAESKSAEKKVKKVTFIELGSVNCVPCKMMQPVMKAIEQEYGDQVDVVFYDVWTPEGSPFGNKFGIKAIPTQIFLDENGNEYYRHIGFFPKEELVKILKMKGVE